MSVILKPCPFCGGNAEYGKETDEFGVGRHYVGCGCIEGCFASGSTKEEAIKTWNNRPSPWHTGTPTEEGCFYALQCEGSSHPEPYFGVVVEGKFSAINYNGDLMPLPPNLIAWQKIEPYKGEKK